MDEFLKDYGILVTAVIGLGMAILSYFFGRWDSERKRKWELDDRKYKKRMEIHDARMKEAIEFIDALRVADEMLYESISALVQVIKEDDSEQLKSELAKAQKNISEMKKPTREAVGKIAGVAYLKDMMWVELFVEYMNVRGKMHDETDRVLDAVTNRDGADLDVIMARIIGLQTDADKLAADMKLRVYELAII